MIGARVILFSYTRDIERVCAAAMRSCYSNVSAFDLYNGKSPEGNMAEKQLTQERAKELIQRALRAGHGSVLEHGLFTFDLQGVSRAFTHQLVRHRIASFSQQSQRHVRIDTDDHWYVIPPNFDDDSRKRFQERMKDLASWYMEESKSGRKIEDARFYLPNAARTNIVVSMNPRELLHVFKLRCAVEAQWEIRTVAWAMLACSKLVAPTIFGEISCTSSDISFKEGEKRLERIVSEARPLFEKAEAHETLEIPLAGLDLGLDVRALVYKC